MVAGAPRTVSPPPEELIEIGKQMVKWVEDNHPLHLSAWWSTKEGYPQNMWDTMIERKEFTPYYEQALLMIGYQYLTKHSDVRDGISQRWQRVYFKDLRKREDADLKYAEELKRKTELETAPNQVQLDKDDYIMRIAAENMRLQLEIKQLKSSNHAHCGIQP